PTFPKARRHVPGEEGMWAFIWGDLIVFSLFFGLFVNYRGTHLALFEHSRLALSRGQGLLNTLLLLTGSVFVATGIAAAREGLHDRAGKWLLGGIACSFGFGLSKVFEYKHKIE